MRRRFQPKALCLLLAALFAVSLSVTGSAKFIDPLDAPATPSENAAKSVLVGLTQAPGGHWVAVGRRGHIVLSTDGKTWKQAESVPVSTDLVSVYFASATHGWAVGHGGVILATTDGGNHWVKQMDGMRVADALVKFYEPLAANSKDPDMAFQLRDAQRFKDSGPGRPFLDVWFADEKRGYATGAYNMLFTTEDGGTTWQPRPDLIVNPNGLHLGIVKGVDHEIYIAGEQGLFARLNAKTGKFDTLKTPYTGSFFSLVGKPGLLVLLALEGTAFRSRDNGANWEKIEPGLHGTLTSGVVLSDGRLVLASQEGTLAISADNGATFSQIKPQVPTPIFAIAPGADNSIVAVGYRGVKTEILK